MNRHQWVRVTAIAVAALVLVLVFAGCGIQDDMNDDRGKGDAPVGDKNDQPASIINMPNEFANVAHKCDGHGHRVYVTREPSNTRQIAVIDDESC